MNKNPVLLNRQIAIYLFGPAHDGEGPQARREPRVQHIRILLKRELLARILGLGLNLSRSLVLTADPAIVVGIVGRSLTFELDIVGRNTMAPPELTRDTPVLDVTQPAEPVAFGHLGRDLHLTVLDSLDTSVSHLLAVDPPLGLHERLNHITRLAADGHGHGVVLDIDKQTLGLQVLDNLLTDMETLHALVGTSSVVEGAVVVQDVDKLEVVALADFVIVQIVGRRDLDSTGTELHIDGDLVGNDRNATIHEGMDSILAVQMSVALIVGVDSNGSVAQHGFDTCGGNDQALVRVFDLVGELVQHTKLELFIVVVAGYAHQRAARQFLVFDLQVRQGGVQTHTPVDQTVGTVNGAFAVQANEGFTHGVREFLPKTKYVSACSFFSLRFTYGVHGESNAVPVVRSTKTVELLVDSVAVFLFPLPHLINERLTSEIVARLLLLVPQLLLDNRLARDTGVISTGVEEHSLAQHTVPSVLR